MPIQLFPSFIVEDSESLLSGNGNNDDDDDGSISTSGSSIIPSGDYEINEKFEMVSE